MKNNQKILRRMIIILLIFVCLLIVCVKNVEAISPAEVKPEITEPIIMPIQSRILSIVQIFMPISLMLLLFMFM